MFRIYKRGIWLKGLIFPNRDDLKFSKSYGQEMATFFMFG